MEGTYYDLYNPFVLIISFIISFVLLFWTFRDYYVTYFNYLTFHFIWNSSIIALLVAYTHKYGVNFYGIIFLLSHIIYLIFLYFFFILYQNKKNKIVYVDIIRTDIKSVKKIKLIYILILFIILYSKSNFFSFISERPDVADWLLYRFEELQGRNPVFRILMTGVLPFFWYFSFLMIKLDIWKKVSIFFLGVYFSIAILAGERSALLGLLLSYSLFIELYNFLYTKKFFLIFNYAILIVLPSIIACLSFVTMFYNRDVLDMSGALSIVLNRIFANGDGVEIYLLEHAENYFDTGLWEFTKSAFGIFLKNLFGIEVKSIGWKLYDIARGDDTAFASGANYILALQVVIMGWWYMFLYVPLMAWLVSKIYITNTKNAKFLCIDYALKSVVFILPTDIEYAILVFISIFIIYIFILYPILTIKWQ